MKKIFEIDPLKCPKCGGPMKIKAFLNNQSEIQRLTSNLNISPQRAPPPLKIFIPEAA
jgi:rRNA maturation endonuclease Nob1